MNAPTLTLSQLKSLREAVAEAAWTVRVVPVAIGLEYTSYAHEVVIGATTITVGHTQHKNYDSIKVEPLSEKEARESAHLGDGGEGAVRMIGIGKRVPDLTPLPLATLISMCPALAAAAERGMRLERVQEAAHDAYIYIPTGDHVSAAARNRLIEALDAAAAGQEGP